MLAWLRLCLMSASDLSSPYTLFLSLLLGEGFSDTCTYGYWGVSAAMGAGPEAGGIMGP